MLSHVEGERGISIGILIIVFGLFMIESAYAGCTPPDCAPAEGWDNFANNLGSDLAPLLALFGEQVTTQYLSESLGWTDCLLFALAPLGIITAMVAAIRVAGTSVLRSVVGRAKETRGDVEADLMSSTSSDVCELWSGGDVVRVLGTPVLLQLVHLKSDVKTEDSAGIFNFRDKATKDRFYKPLESDHIQPSPNTNETSAEVDGQDAYLDPSFYSDIEHLQARNNPPNLSLNVSIKPIPTPRMIAFLIIGIFAQGAVLAFAAVAQYKLRLPKNNTSIPGYAFPIFLFGTLTLASGVFLCALAVERSTKETTWEPLDRETTFVAWLQQGGQKVGDQQFGSFALLDSPGIIFTSEKKKDPKGRHALVAVAVFVTCLGFIAQFFGLRATHSSVIVLQLGAILLMTALRSCAHVSRGNHNHITNPDQVEGYELDWLAKNLAQCSTWEVMTVLSKDSQAELVTSHTPTSLQASQDESPDPAPVTEPKTEPMAVTVVRTRARLAELSNDWVLNSRDKVAALQKAIEGSINDVFAKMKIKGDWRDETSFKWGVPVKAQRKFSDGSPDIAQNCEISLTLERKRDEIGGWGGWRANKNEVEAILCLWVSSLVEFDRAQAKIGEPRLKQVRLLGPANLTAKIDYKLWIYRGTKAMKHRRTKLDGKRERYFGWSGGSSAEYFCVDTDSNLEDMCAQGLYTLFLGRLVSWVEGIGGNTTRRTNDLNAGLRQSAESENPWGHLYLSNSNFMSLAQIFEQSSLGTIEEAYLCIIPVFSSVEKPPYPDEVYSTARKTANVLVTEEKWEDAAEIDSWLYQNSSPNNAPTSAILIEVTRHLDRLCGRLLSGIKKHEQDERLRPLWDVVDYQCGVISTAEPSNDLSFSMVVRCMTYLQLNGSPDPREFRKLITETIEYVTKGKVSPRLRENVEEGWKGGVFKESESFTKFLFEQIYNGLFEEKEDQEPLTLILALIREKSGDVFSSKQITRYFNDPESLKVAANTVATAQLEVSSDDIPVDMLLTRKYLSPLQFAAGIGNKQIVKKLLDAGAQINAEPARFGGRTALQAAASGGHYETVQFLLARGANLKAKPAPVEGRTALQAAAGGGHRIVVERLLAGGVNANPGQTDGRTALQAAAEGGHEDIVQFLLDRSAEPNAKPATYGGRTALQAAAGAGHSNIVSQLLKAGAKINDSPARSDGRTALQAAAEDGHEEIVELLLKHGANVNADPASSVGRTALQAAAGAGHGEVLKQLHQVGANVNGKAGPVYGRTALQAAVEGGHRNTAALLLALGSDINAAPSKEEGKTVWQAVLEKGDPRMMELILTSDAFDAEAALHSALEREKTVADQLLGLTAVDWNRRTGAHRETPLHRAVRCRHGKTFDPLVNTLEVNPNITDVEGRSPLCMAVEFGYVQGVELLVSYARTDTNLVNSRGLTPLFIAAQTGQIPIVGSLLKRPSVDVNLGSPDGRTPLHAAAMEGHDKVIQMLLDREEIDVDATDIAGMTPLHFASLNGLDNAVMRLLSWGGFDVNHRNGIGATPLLLAVSQGAGAVVRRLLARPEVQLDLGNFEGNSPLLVAASAGDQLIFGQLLAKGANVNHKNRNQSTALHIASAAGYVAIATMLLNAQGIQIDPVDDSGWTPLACAAHRGHCGVVEQLLTKGVNINHNTMEQATPLCLASEEGHWSVVNILLAAPGVAVSSPDSLGITPLHMAALRGHHFVVEQLLAKVTDVNLCTREKATPLHMAAVGGHELVVEKLLAAPGVEVNLQRDDGATPLFLAARLGHHLVVERLLAHEGLDVNYSPSTKLTPLLAAAEAGYDAIVKQLLQKDIDANQRGPEGETALWNAAISGHNAVVRTLVTMGKVDVNLMDSREATPLLVAAQNGHEEVVKSLLELAQDTINVNYADEDGVTPLISAAKAGHRGVVEQLLKHKKINVDLLDAHGNSVLQHSFSIAIRSLFENFDNT